MLFKLTRIDPSGEEEIVEVEAPTLADALAQFADYFAGDYRPTAGAGIAIDPGSIGIQFFH